MVYGHDLSAWVWTSLGIGVYSILVMYNTCLGCGKILCLLSYDCMDTQTDLNAG